MPLERAEGFPRLHAVGKWDHVVHVGANVWVDIPTEPHTSHTPAEHLPFAYRYTDKTVAASADGTTGITQ